jgi:hypothetical protein
MRLNQSQKFSLLPPPTQIRLRLPRETGFVIRIGFDPEQNPRSDYFFTVFYKSWSPSKDGYLS